MIETSHVSGWRCSAELRLDPENRAQSIALELDRNTGGMWPRVVIEASAKPSKATAIWIAEATTTGEAFESFSGMRYERGIGSWCVAAIASGVAEGLRGEHGVEIVVTSGGVAVDTAEAVCQKAAQVATRLLIASLGEPRSLEDVLGECVEAWSGRSA